MLPTEKSLPITDLSQQTILIYGEKKVGKTEFASHFPDALFLCTEPGHNHIEAYKKTISTWEEMIDVCNEIKAGKHPFKTIVIDTLEMLYDCCKIACLKEAEANYMTDKSMKWGRAEEMIGSKLNGMLKKLAKLPYGLVLISHSRQIAINGATENYTKNVPGLQLTGVKMQVRDLCEEIVGMADLILYCDVETSYEEGKDITRHYMYTHPNKYYTAGCRMPMPARLPLRYNAFYEAYTSSTNTKTETEGDK